jgi:hypothetical protein
MTDYSDYVDAPEGDGLAELRRLADELDNAEGEVKRVERELKIAQARVKELSEEVLPAKMQEVGLESLKTPSGFEVEIKESVFAHIAKERAAKAFAWLDANKHGGMIKRTVIVAFNKDQETLAKNLHLELSDKFPGVTEAMKVEPATLKAWAKKRLEAGDDVPLELFGIHTKRVAKINRKKKKK